MLFAAHSIVKGPFIVTRGSRIKVPRFPKESCLSLNVAKVLVLPFKNDRNIIKFSAKNYFSKLQSKFSSQTPTHRVLQKDSCIMMAIFVWENWKNRFEENSWLSIQQLVHIIIPNHLYFPLEAYATPDTDNTYGGFTNTSARRIDE